MDYYSLFSVSANQSLLNDTIFNSDHQKIGCGGWKPTIALARQTSSRRRPVLGDRYATTNAIADVASTGAIGMATKRRSTRWTRVAVRGGRPVGFLALGAERRTDGHRAVSRRSIAAGASENGAHLGVEVVRGVRGVRYCRHSDGREGVD